MNRDNICIYWKFGIHICGIKLIMSSHSLTILKLPSFSLRLWLRQEKHKCHTPNSFSSLYCTNGRPMFLCWCLCFISLYFSLFLSITSFCVPGLLSTTLTKVLRGSSSLDKTLYFKLLSPSVLYLLWLVLNTLALSLFTFSCFCLIMV